jgi:Tol biopolymer transport system component
VNAFAADQPLGVFSNSGDVGSPKNPGSTTYDATKRSYTLTGSGENMWADRDEFQFVWKQIKGDFIVTARGKFLSEGGQPHKKFGWTARASLDPNSANVSTPLHGEGLAALLDRKTPGGKTEEQKFSQKGADVVQLERRGNTYIMSIAKFGEPFVSQEVTDLDLGDEPYVGLFVCAHNKNEFCKVQFDDVRITIPAAAKFVPYKDYIGSNLEILDLDTGHRETIYHVSDSLQAPNWTLDSKALIYNRNGELYRFDLAKREPTLINTAPATHNNNDHVISPDGQWLGISNHVKEDGNKSIVFVVPLDGGQPRRITPQGNSYFHSWSPDGRELIFTGERNKVFDIYRIWLEGGDETKITDGKGLNDGPEYSPDGKYIFFNSTRGGANMQIYRMKPDGTDIQQLAHDDYNNWFPHISPDKKWISIISFPNDIDPKDHPFYKHVYLRLMPYSGGDPTVIAYLYGGQGTINVSSWSPDSKKLAFVSNTAGD